MRKSLILATLIGGSVLSQAAFAAALSDTGPIKTIDAKTSSITLDDGKVFVLPKGFKIETVKVGEKVAVTYAMKDKAMMAMEVTVAK